MKAELEEYFGFAGASNEHGNFEFTATLDDGNGGQASLTGELAESLDSRNVFGVGGSQEGDHVWDVLSFGGNTTAGESRFLLFNGLREAGIEIGVDVDELGIAGDHPKTVEAWVFARSFGEAGGVFDLGTWADGQNFSLRTSAGVQEEWHGQFWGGADTWFDVPGSYKQWTHIATVYDGTTLRLYANGELVTERNVELNTQPGGGMRIGIWGTWDTEYPFHGAIREVRVWNSARSESEIQATMNSSPAGESGLLGWWPLNEGVGEIAYDNSGNGRHGVITEPEWTPAVRSFSIGGPDEHTAFLDFDGNTSVVENDLTASDLGVGGSNPKTMEAWIRAAAFDGAGVLQLGERGSAGHDFSLRVSGRLNEWQGQFWGQDMWFLIPDSLNNWTHVAITYDGTTVRAYGNGNLVDIADIDLNTQNGPFVIGNWWDGGHPFNGAVRDVRIWNVTRSGSEIRANMYSSPAGQTGLAGWWPLSEGEGTVAGDHSGNDRDGTIVDPVWDFTPTVWTFDTARVIRSGQSVTLAWESLGTTTSIAPGVGEVAAEGTLEVTPPSNALTHYSLSATDQNGVIAQAPRLWVRTVLADGFETLRYLRFEIPGDSGLRDPGEDSIQLSRVLFHRDGGPVPAIEVTNPGGDNPAGGGPENLIGDDPNTQWRDFNKAHLNDSHLVFDFGEEVEIDSYRLGTSMDFPGRDPVRWRLFARSSTADEWELIDDMTLDYPVPAGRGRLTEIIPLGWTVETGQTFSDWAESYFDEDEMMEPEISGLLATPANDGVANLLKYAFGLDPWTPVSGNDLPEASVEGTKLVLTYPERLDAFDIAYVPQGSFDLDGWDSTGTQEVSRDPHEADPNLEWVTVELELSDAERAFLRVQIQKTD